MTLAEVPILRQVTLAVFICRAPCDCGCVRKTSLSTEKPDASHATSCVYDANSAKLNGNVKLTRLPPHILPSSKSWACMKLKQACAKRTFSPIPPYQLLEGIDADVVWVHVLDGDIALLEIFLIDLVRMPSSS